MNYRFLWQKDPSALCSLLCGLKKTSAQAWDILKYCSCFDAQEFHVVSQQKFVQVKFDSIDIEFKYEFESVVSIPGRQLDLLLPYWLLDGGPQIFFTDKCSLLVFDGSMYCDEKSKTE
jgi:hypothetical protein